MSLTTGNSNTFSITFGITNSWAAASAKSSCLEADFLSMAAVEVSLMARTVSLAARVVSLLDILAVGAVEAGAVDEDSIGTASVLAEVVGGAGFFSLA